nr:YadA-like family protein [Escherichia coli]EII23223.1 hypothetical protein EC90111_5497 [Escherichia coli 9.0111]
MTGRLLRWAWGYRFNEQAAAKAGTAFSDGDVSWNVGVNWEF